MFRNIRVMKTGMMMVMARFFLSMDVIRVWTMDDAPISNGTSPIAAPRERSRAANAPHSASAASVSDWLSVGQMKTSISA